MNGNPRSSPQVSPELDPVGPSRPRSPLTIVLLGFLSVTVGLIFFLNHKSPQKAEPPAESAPIPEALPNEPVPEASAVPATIEKNLVPPPATFRNPNPLGAAAPTATLPVLPQPQIPPVAPVAPQPFNGGTAESR